MSHSNMQFSVFNLYSETSAVCFLPVSMTLYIMWQIAVEDLLSCQEIAEFSPILDNAA